MNIYRIVRETNQKFELNIHAESIEKALELAAELEETAEPKEITIKTHYELVSIRNSD